MKRLLLIILLIVGCATNTIHTVVSEPIEAKDRTCVELWGECYSIEHTTEIALFKRGATGDFTSVVGEISESIGNLINLRELALDGNKLTGEIPESIGNLINLTYLNLERNQLTGKIPESIGNLTNLTYLGLRDNQLTGEIPENISKLNNLTSLSLWGNQLNGKIPESVCNLSDKLEGIFCLL